MTPDGDHWKGSTQWTLIFSDYLHPGEPSYGLDSVPILKWVAPKAGTISIGGTVRKLDVSCGDGVSASIVHAGNSGGEIFRADNIQYDDAVGESIDPSLAVRWVDEGDGIFFMIWGRGNNYCDSTYWNPSIAYQ
jgi:hypothetical protein